MSASRKISEATCSDEVFRRCEELKLKHVKEVDPLASLLAKIQSDEKVKNVIKRDMAAKTNGSAPLFDRSNISVTSQNSQNDSLQKKFLSTITANRREYQEKKNVSNGIYSLPSWVRDRPNISWNYSQEFRQDFSHSGPIGVLPPNVQESRLIDDILFCLVGIDGDYVHSKKSSNSGKLSNAGLLQENGKEPFCIDDSTNEASKLLVHNMLPMFSYYSKIVSFVEENTHYERGLVNHALSAGIRTFLRDYFALVSQLEKQHLQQNLTLQKLWFYLQPSMATMETIAGIVSELSKGDVCGGNVLTVLHENAASLTGSSKSCEIYHFLTRAASRPYFEILDKWIYKGVIVDYYSEFLVEDNELIKKEHLPTEYSNDYWEKRYTLRTDQIPVFLSKVADTILQTGKYLNVVRQCGKTVNFPDAKSLVYSMRENQYVEYIEPAYHFASRQLLDLLLDEMDLKGRLMSVKHYFLLDHGDFTVQFMDMAEEELQKDVGEIVIPTLESLLELALRTSVVNDDKYKDDLGFELLQMNFLSQLFKILQIRPDMQGDSCDLKMLTGLEAFAFTYKVKWPLSLVINSKALACYQILFRHLFYCKHIENLLGRLWSLNKKAKSFPRSEICHYVSAFALRQRMLNFIQNLNYYLTLEVIEPHWNAFYKRIQQVTNVDELLYLHDDFLEKCIVNCMLTDTRFLNVLAALMKLCADFSSFLQNMMKSSTDIDASVIGDSMLYSINEQPFPELSSCPATLENFQQQISHFEKKFDEGIVRMLGILHVNSNQSKQTSTIINMLYRLDFSKFYEEMSLKELEHYEGV